MQHTLNVYHNCDVLTIPSKGVFEQDVLLSRTLFIWWNFTIRTKIWNENIVQRTKSYTNYQARRTKISKMTRSNYCENVWVFWI